jgi:hypothetical protein
MLAPLIPCFFRLFWHKPMLCRTKSADFLPGNTSFWMQIQDGKIKNERKILRTVTIPGSLT